MDLHYMNKQNHISIRQYQLTMKMQHALQQ